LEVMHTPSLRLANLGKLEILFPLLIMVEYQRCIGAVSFESILTQYFL